MDFGVSASVTEIFTFFEISRLLSKLLVLCCLGC